MRIICRFARLPDDYPGIARVVNAESPESKTTPERLAREVERWDSRFHRAMFVAETTDQEEHQIIGVATAGHDTTAYREGKFILNIRVDPEMQGHGIGKGLYKVLLEHLEPHAPRELHGEVWEAHSRAVRFVTQRGFVAEWRRIDARLDVAGFDFTPYTGLEERLRSLGIEVVSYRDVEPDPERLEKLYELDWELLQDVPAGQVITQVPIAQFDLETVQDVAFIPEACFMALHHGEPVGYCNLIRGSGYLMTQMTGVLRAYRGKGVATLLKVRGIRYAREHGYQEIRTVNDAPNTAMIALNERLGFRPRGATVRFVKRVGNDA